MKQKSLVIALGYTLAVIAAANLLTPLLWHALPLRDRNMVYLVLAMVEIGFAGTVWYVCWKRANQPESKTAQSPAHRAGRAAEIFAPLRRKQACGCRDKSYTAYRRPSACPARAAHIFEFILTFIAINSVRVVFAILVGVVVLIDPQFLEKFPMPPVTQTRLVESPWLPIYLIALAPFAEELLFRKVLLGLLSPAGFWWANLLQAVCFGVFHLNLLQGINAFGLGLILGLAAHRRGWLTGVWLHAMYNLTSVLMMIH